METWEIIAIDKKAVIRFKNDNKEIQGVRFLLRGSEPAQQAADRFCGFNWHDQFISNERLSKMGVTPQVGDTINLVFNRYGDIVSITVV